MPHEKTFSPNICLDFPHPIKPMLDTHKGPGFHLCGSKLSKAKLQKLAASSQEKGTKPFGLSLQRLDDFANCKVLTIMKDRGWRGRSGNCTRFPPVFTASLILGFSALCGLSMWGSLLSAEVFSRLLRFSFPSKTIDLIGSYGLC